MAVLGTFAQASRTNSGVRTELHAYSGSKPRVGCAALPCCGDPF